MVEDWDGFAQELPVGAKATREVSTSQGEEDRPQKAETEAQGGPTLGSKCSKGWLSLQWSQMWN